MPINYKIAIWNFGFGSLGGSPSFKKKEIVVEALQYANSIGCTSILAQEICNLSGLQNFKDIYPYSIYYTVPNDKPEGIWGGRAGNDIKNCGDSQQWGTAILSKNPLKTIHLEINTAYPGTMILAIDEINHIGLISIYGKRIGNEEYVTNLHRCLSDLTAVLNDPCASNGFILGGDLNIGSLRTEKISARSGIVIERIHNLGFIDCGDPTAPYTCTYHGGNVDRQSQVDWSFASKKLPTKLKSYATIDNSLKAKALSDHYPIIMEFNL